MCGRVCVTEREREREKLFMAAMEISTRGKTGKHDKWLSSPSSSLWIFLCFSSFDAAMSLNYRHIIRTATGNIGMEQDLPVVTRGTAAIKK